MLSGCSFVRQSTAVRRRRARRTQEQCVERVEQMGDIFGRDRVVVNTVAFGPPSDDYGVLMSMAEALPRHSFQKLGLSSSCLSTAFTSLASSLTTLRTEAGGGGGALALRPNITKQGARQVYAENDVSPDF